jgi:hypothetical protein
MLFMTDTIRQWVTNAGGGNYGAGLARIDALWTHAFVTTLDFEPGRRIALDAYQRALNDGQIVAGSEGRAVWYYYYNAWTQGQSLNSLFDQYITLARTGGAGLAPVVPTAQPVSLALPAPGSDPTATAVSAALALIRSGRTFDPQQLVAFYFSAPGFNTALYLRDLATRVVAEGLTFSPGQVSPWVVSGREVSAAEFLGLVPSADTRIAPTTSVPTALTVTEQQTLVGEAGTPLHVPGTETAISTSLVDPASVARLPVLVQEVEERGKVGIGVLIALGVVAWLVFR